jgi:hypothetical protein
MSRRLLVIVALALALVVPGAANATRPTLLTVAQQNRHATATFSMPGADDATIYFASKPDRASDGSFLEENVVASDFLTTDEIQHGSWLYEEQLDPGTYYVMMRAYDFDCLSSQPNCIDGYSTMLTLTIPKPPQRFRGSVEVLEYVNVAYLTLRVTPLGDTLPYKVCWRLKTKRRRCVTGVVEGYSWNSSAEDSVRVRMRGMAKRTTFVWYVGGRKVAARTSKTVRR